MNYQRQVQQIKEKFLAIKRLDNSFLQAEKDKNITPSSNIQNERQQVQKSQYNKQPLLNRRFTKDNIKNDQNQEMIFTKSDICKKISKLNPYLQIHNAQLTTSQIEEKNQKQLSEQQFNMLSDMITYYSKMLCNKLSEEAEIKEIQIEKGKQKQGWVFQLFYRYVNSQNSSQLEKQQLRNVYGILTEYLQLYENLTFSNLILRITMDKIKLVKYLEDKQFQIIQIRLNDGIIQIGFINEAQLRLFDRMLFLQKNMVRASSTRLFQNHLLKSIYSQFEA